MVTPSTFPSGDSKVLTYGPHGGVSAIVTPEVAWLCVYHWYRPSAWDQAIAWAFEQALEPLDDLPAITFRDLDLYELVALN